MIDHKRFAAEAFGALQSEMAEEETGWQVEDCGAKGADEEPTESTDWHATLTRIAVPETAHALGAQWGSGGDPLLLGEAPAKRGPLIDKVAGTADPYDAADARVALESHLLDEAIALPLAVDPVVTVSARGVENVRVDGDASATLLETVGEWGPDE